MDALKKQLEELQKFKDEITNKRKYWNRNQKKYQQKYRSTEKGLNKIRATQRAYYHRKKAKKLKEQQKEIEILPQLTEQEEEQLMLFKENPAKYGVKPNDAIILTF